MNSHDLKRGLSWAFASVLLVSAAQMSLKYGMQRLHVEPDFSDYLQALASAKGILPIALGMAAYGLSVLCWLAALARLPLSLAYPILSLSYLMVYLAAVLMPGFNETVNPTRLGGVALVMVGVCFVAMPYKNKEPTAVDSL